MHSISTSWSMSSDTTCKIFTWFCFWWCIWRNGNTLEITHDIFWHSVTEHMSQCFNCIVKLTRRFSYTKIYSENLCLQYLVWTFYFISTRQLEIAGFFNITCIWRGRYSRRGCCCSSSDSSSSYDAITNHRSVYWLVHVTNRVGHSAIRISFVIKVFDLQKHNRKYSLALYENEFIYLESKSSEWVKSERNGIKLPVVLGVQQSQRSHLIGAWDIFPTSDEEF